MNWAERYEAELEKLQKGGLQSKAPFNKVLYVVWEYGILEHLSPSERAAQDARIVQHDGWWNRDDPALYWRILYAVLYTHEMFQRKWGIIDGYIAWPLALLLKYNLTAGMPPHDFSMQACSEFRDNAEARLEKLGHVPHRIPKGARGHIFRGEGEEVHATVVGYTGTGLINLRRDPNNRRTEFFAEPYMLDAKQFSISGVERVEWKRANVSISEPRS